MVAWESSVFVLGGGGGGQSASGAVKGECFESALEFGGGDVAVAVVVAVVLSVFVFGGRAGGQSASGCVCCFCGEWRRVSFRGCEGEMIMKGMGSESASGGAMEKGLMSSSFEGGHRGWAQTGRM